MCGNVQNHCIVSRVQFHSTIYVIKLCTHLMCSIRIIERCSVCIPRQICHVTIELINGIQNSYITCPRFVADLLHVKALGLSPSRFSGAINQLQNSDP